VPDAGQMVDLLFVMCYLLFSNEPKASSSGHPNGGGIVYPPPYLHPFSAQGRLSKQCRTGLAIVSVIYAFRSLIVVTSDVFIACLRSSRSGYPTARSSPTPK